MQISASHYKQKGFISLRYKLTVTSFLVSLFAALVIFSSFYFQGREILDESAEYEVQREIDFVAPVVSNLVNQTLYDTEVISKAPTISELISVRSKVSAIERLELDNMTATVNGMLSLVVGGKSEFAHLMLKDEQGQIIAQSQHEKLSQELYLQIQNTARAAFLERQGVPRNNQVSFKFFTPMSDFQGVSTSSIDGAAQSITQTQAGITGYLLIIRQVETSDQSSFFLVATVALESFMSVLEAFQREDKHYYLIAADSTVAYQTSDTRRLIEAETKVREEIEKLMNDHVSASFVSLDEVMKKSLNIAFIHRLAFSQGKALSPLYLVALHRENRLAQAFQRLEGQAIIIGIILAFSISALSLVLASRLVRPMLGMMKSIRAYEETGKIEALPTTKNDEVGRLALSFKKMVASVQRHQASLLEVVDKTNHTSKLLQSVLDSLPDALIRVDSDGNIIAFNHAAENMFDFPESQVTGQQFGLLMPYEFNQRFLTFQQYIDEHYDKLTKGDGDEQSAIRRDGEIFPVLINYSVINSDTAKSYTVIVKDNTYSKLLESERIAALKETKDLAWRLDFALSASQVGVWEFNSKTNRLSWDKRMFRLYGIENQDNVYPEQIWLKSIDAEYRDAVKAAINQSLETGQNFHQIYRVNLADSSSVYIETHAKVIFESQGKFHRLVGTSQDVTEQHMLDELKQNALDMAEDSLRLKSEFLASMSHEIRTPMNGVLGMLGLLGNSELSKQQKHYLELASSSAHSLLDLLNDILDFSKIEAGKIDIENVDFNLTELFCNVSESFAFKAQKKGVELVLDVASLSDVEVSADPTRIRQILTNLISNAIKFTERGEVVVRAKVRSVSDGFQLSCSVQDSGVGIHEEHIGKLFDSFTQVDSSTTRKYGGTGLGLAIVKKLCHLMGGEISVESKLGWGSKFSFELTLSNSKTFKHTLKNNDRSESCTIEEINDGKAFGNINVLIVDSNISSANALSKLLATWGVSNSIVNNSKQALDALESSINLPFNIAMVNCTFEDITGAEICQKLIESEHNYGNIKCALMTPIAFRNDADMESIEAITDILSKPITPFLLRDVLFNLTQKKAENFSEKEVRIKSTEAIGKRRIKNTYAAQVFSEALHGSTGRESSQLVKTLECIKLLVVEDNRVNQAVIKGLLEDMPADITLAENGVEALNLLNQHQLDTERPPFDLILMDCQMPEMDGYQTTQAIRAGKTGESYKTIPIIAMTANAMKGDKEKCLSVGMDDYLAKPIDTALFFEKLAYWGLAVTKADTVDEGVLDVSSEETCMEECIANTSQEAKEIGEENKESASIIWDEQALLKRVRDNQALAEKLLELFIDEAPDQLASILMSLETNDKNEIVAHAHKLKGAANNISANQLGELLYELEHCAKSENREKLTHFQTVLPLHYQALMERLNDYFTSLHVE